MQSIALVCTVGLSVLSFSLYLAYTIYRPKPLVGIPFNEDAARRLLGDVPEMMAYVMRTKRIFCWLTSLTTRHQSPIVQAFIKPGGLPWVVVTDPFESQDILLRRFKDFDRSEFFGELINGILPEQHIQFISTDPRFKNNRNLINHLMAPTFIREVSGPEVYLAAQSLLKLWKIKCQIAQGGTFSAHRDVTLTVLDSIFASSFGLPESESNIFQQINAIKTYRTETIQDTHEPLSFPEGTMPEISRAVLTLANSVTDTQLSPAPALTSWFIRKLPYMAKAEAIKDKYIKEKVDDCVHDMEKDDAIHPRSALHSVLLRERDLAAKEGRKPDYWKRAIADEFFGFMTAGHDTSATTIAWGLKLLTDNPSVQNRLRDHLYGTFSEAAHEGRDFTYSELSAANLPYLDAVIEEVLRLANTIAFVVRQAQRNTTVLGHMIPKGTNVFLMANGPGYMEPNMEIDDNTRSSGARRASKLALSGKWEDDEIASFKPERWLNKEPKTGSDVFNSMAGPSLAFGMGLRGCFGKKLALQVLKIHFGLLIWNFHLLPIPANLGGYEAVQKFAREPVQCYVRLKQVNRG